MIVGLSVLLVAYFLLEGEGFAIARNSEAIGLFGLIFSGLILVTVVSDLRATLDNVELDRAAMQAERDGRGVHLAELEHRIFNDLSSMAAIATLKATATAAEHDETRAALTRMATRIQVFGGVYRRLNARDRADGFARMGAYLSGLCNDLRTAHLGIRQIILSLRAEPLDLAVSRAVLVGLVLNECVTNALKHAFPNDQPGTIEIDFRRDPAPGALRLRSPTTVSARPHARRKALG